MSGNEKQRRRAAAAREIESRQKAESDYAEWTARTNRTAASDPISPVRDTAIQKLRAASSTAQAAVELNAAFPSLTRQTIVAACDWASALLDSAGDVALRVWEHEISRQQALEHLSETCPGFSADGYERAFGVALFETSR